MKNEYNNIQDTLFLLFPQFILRLSNKRNINRHYMREKKMCHIAYKMKTTNVIFKAYHMLPG